MSWSEPGGVQATHRQRMRQVEVKHGGTQGNVLLLGKSTIPSSRTTSTGRLPLPRPAPSSNGALDSTSWGGGTQTGSAGGTGSRGLRAWRSFAPVMQARACVPKGHCPRRGTVLAIVANVKRADHMLPSRFPIHRPHLFNYSVALWHQRVGSSKPSEVTPSPPRLCPDSDAKVLGRGGTSSVPRVCPN